MQATNNALREGIRLFNARKYFEAHEALEALWLKSEGAEKLFLHGLIQIAAAFHHHRRRNPAGFRSLLDKGMQKLETLGETRSGIDVAGLRRQAERWREYTHSARPVAPPAPPLPRIKPAARRPR